MVRCKCFSGLLQDEDLEFSCEMKALGQEEEHHLGEHPTTYEHVRRNAIVEHRQVDEEGMVNEDVLIRGSADIGEE